MPIFLLLLINPSLQTNLKIVKTRSGSDRPEPCATICAGETGPNPTFRKYHDGNVEFLIIDRIDMSECGFVEPPIVNVYLESRVTRTAEWTHAANNLSRYGFTLYITSNTGYTNSYSGWNLNVMWSAYGYDC